MATRLPRVLSDAHPGNSISVERALKNIHYVLEHIGTPSSTDLEDRYNVALDDLETMINNIGDE